MWFVVLGGGGVIWVFDIPCQIPGRGSNPGGLTSKEPYNLTLSNKQDNEKQLLSKINGKWGKGGLRKNAINP